MFSLKRLEQISNSAIFLNKSTIENKYYNILQETLDIVIILNNNLSTKACSKLKTTSKKYLHLKIVDAIGIC